MILTDADEKEIKETEKLICEFFKARSTKPPNAFAALITVALYIAKDSGLTKESVAGIINQWYGWEEENNGTC